MMKMTRRNYSTRYSEGQILDVKRHLEVASRRKDGGLASGERQRISRATGVSVETIHAVNHGSTWRWIDAEETVA
jgi:hypothetical protein